MNNIVIVLNKTNTNDIAKDLVSCVLTYDFLCLSKSQKWYICFAFAFFFCVSIHLLFENVCRCSEMLYSLTCMEDASAACHLNLNDDSFKFNHSDLVSTKDIVSFQLARSYFNLKEYLRASNYLLDGNVNATFINQNENHAAAGSCYFLYIYSKYMAIMKKCVDNKADLFSEYSFVCNLLNYLLIFVCACACV